MRRSERVDEEHEKQARVDSNVVLETGGISHFVLLFFLSLLAVLWAQLREKIGFLTLTLPTVPMAFTYVQLLAREILDQKGFEHRSGTMLTTNRHMLGWEDFGGSLLAYISITSHVRIYLGDTSWVVHKAL